jgi:hypothetical protein
MANEVIPLLTQEDYVRELAKHCYANDPELLAAVVEAHRATLTSALIKRAHGALLRKRAEKERAEAQHKRP